MEETNAVEALETLFPDQTTQAGDREVTVRELAFLQGLASWGYAEQLYRDLAELFGENDGKVEALRLLQVFAHHHPAVTKLLAVSTGLTEAELQALGDENGQNLLLLFWQVNQSFFGRRLALVWAGKKAQTALE